MAQYEILDKLGEGGMGVVYRALQLPLRRTVALKLLPKHLNEDPVFARRFMREVRAGSDLNHPNIVKIFDFGSEDGRLYFAMELIEGRTLQSWIRHDPEETRSRAEDVLEQLLDALAFMHARGFVHRDIKTANVMRDDSGHVTLMDFGLVKDQRSEQTVLTEVGRAVGTPSYMAPEILLGQPGGPASDMWALGCLYHQLLTGRLPFERSSTHEAMRAILDDPIPALPVFPSGPQRAREHLLAHMLTRSLDERARDGSEALALFRVLVPREVPPEPEATEEASREDPSHDRRRGRTLRLPGTTTIRSGPGAATRALQAPPSPVGRGLLLPGVAGAGLLALGILAAGLSHHRGSADGPGGTAGPATAGSPGPAISPAPVRPGGADPGPGDPEPEALRRALFRLRPRALADEICDDWHELRSRKAGDLEHEERVRAWRARVANRLADTGVEAALARWRAAPARTGPGSEAARPSGKELYSALMELHVLLGVMSTIQARPDLSLADAFPGPMRPLVREEVLPPGEVVLLGFEDERIAEMERVQKVHHVDRELGTALNLWVSGGAPRSFLARDLGRRESTHFVSARPLPFRPVRPGERVVLDVYARFFAPGEHLEVRFPGSPGQRVPAVVVRGQSAKRVHGHHEIDPDLVAGPRHVELDYHYCQDLGQDGDVQIYLIAVHYLSAELVEAMR